MGILIYLIPGAENPVVLGILIIIGFFVGVYTSNQVAKVEGHKLTRSAELAKGLFQNGEHKTPDPSIVVIDEMVGIWITLLFLPKTWMAILIAFLAFRGFDIVKLPPARQLENIPNGWGIMLDDVVAGIYAWIASEFACVVMVRAFAALR